MRTGHFAGDSADPRNRVESDGLSTNQRNWIQGLGRMETPTARRWTRKLVKMPNGEYEWITRDELDRLIQSGPRAPVVQTFKPEFYPTLDKFISSASELRSEMKRQGKEFRF